MRGLFDELFHSFGKQFFLFVVFCCLIFSVVIGLFRANKVEAESDVSFSDMRPSLPNGFLPITYSNLTNETVPNEVGKSLGRVNTKKVDATRSVIEVGGWALRGDEADGSYLNRGLFPFTTISPFWFEVTETGSEIREKSSAVPMSAIVINAHKARMSVWPTITGDPNVVSLVLQNDIQRALLERAIVDKVESIGVDGIDIDFEQLDRDDNPYFVVFLSELGNMMHAKHKKLSVALEARLNNNVFIDWHAVGEVADRVEIMIYDYHSRQTSAPGPIGPVGWANDVIGYAKDRIPKAKIIVAFGVYGYDWTQPDLLSSYSGQGVTFADVADVLVKYKVVAERATGTDERGYDVGRVPNFSYIDETNLRHDVWYEDAESIMNKVSGLRDIGGIYFWRLGSEDKTVWPKMKEFLGVK